MKTFREYTERHVSNNPLNKGMIMNSDRCDEGQQVTKRLREENYFGLKCHSTFGKVVSKWVLVSTSCWRQKHFGGIHKRFKREMSLEC